MKHHPLSFSPIVIITFITISILKSQSLSYRQGPDITLNHSPSGIATESVTLVSPPNDTTCYCPKKSILIQWKASPGDDFKTSYHVQASTDTTFTNYPLLVDDIGMGNLSIRWFIPVLGTSMTVYWRVTSKWSTDWSEVRKINIVFPCALQLLSPPNDTTVCGSTTLKCHVPANTKSLRFSLYADSAGGTLVGTYNHAPNDTTLFFSTSNFQTFVWQITIIDSSDKSMVSEVRRFNVVIPAIIELLLPANDDSVEYNNVHLTWKPDSYATKYVVFIQGDGGFMEYDTVSAAELKRTLATNSHYAWKVCGLCADLSAGTYSAPQSFTTVAVAGVDNDNSASGFSITPNPIHSEAVITLPYDIASSARVSVYNSLGECIYTFGSPLMLNGRLMWNVAALNVPSGVYHVVVQSDVRLYSGDCVVIRE